MLARRHYNSADQKSWDMAFGFRETLACLRPSGSSKRGRGISRLTKHTALNCAFPQRDV
jgi:hypothetical protein